MTEPRTSRRPLSDWARPSAPVATAPARGARARGDAPRRSGPANREAQTGRHASRTQRPATTRRAPAPAPPRRGALRRPQAQTQTPVPSQHDPAALRRLAGAVAPTRGSAAPALRPAVRPGTDAPAAAPRHLRVVGPRSRSTVALRRRARGLVLVGTVAVIAVAFGLVYLHVLSAQKQFELNGLTSTEQQAQANYQQLRLAVGTDNSPARIMAEASRLGMVEPGHVTAVPAVAGGTVTPASDPSVVGGSTAPGGVANWSGTKADLAGTP